ncbi:winged helix-turn-helix domain-containing protein [Klebsiella sp. I138]|uniref:winged helix-turn-helix domain-containing protein n=1 Tax=Klebsiella sp. I138 TaxID=2755385 RepID=UPI003DA9AD8F
MATIYVIENTLRFNSEAHTLHSIKSNEHITLAIPASLCFDLLIQNQGRIVTQAELLQNAWGERGMNVTPNTLHQNISLLRKSLNRLNVNGTLIQTIPKRGFMIADDANIRIDSPDTNTENGPKNGVDSVTPQINIVVAEERSNYHQDSQQLHADPPVEQGKDDDIPKGIIGAVKKRKTGWIIAGITTLLIFLLHVYISQSAATDSPFASYALITTVNNCKIFRNDDLRFDEYYIEFLKEHNITCSNGKNIYITNHYPSSRTSLIACRYPIKSNKKSFCTSSYYLK